MGEIQARSRVVLEDFNARFDALEGDGEEWIVPAALALPEAVLDMDAGRRDIISRGLIDGSGEAVDQVFSRNVRHWSGASRARPGPSTRATWRGGSAASS